ncbi:hypothetical protein HPB50_019464 [Hyalomma asiaticum]|uniref:Uncharacterized protein n=1 Tax=Hyalomma asiaticum TaxID=266040 RepID=A0ACB7S7P3_HYAAI|nr:hypothetical protein HPB50_019464 [Hyalomma asiaticum]
MLLLTALSNYFMKSDCDADQSIREASRFVYHSLGKEVVWKRIDEAAEKEGLDKAAKVALARTEAEHILTMRLTETTGRDLLSTERVCGDGATGEPSPGEEEADASIWLGSDSAR